MISETSNFIKNDGDNSSFTDIYQNSNNNNNTTYNGCTFVGTDNPTNPTSQNNKIITNTSPSGTSTVFSGRENDIENIKEKAKTKKIVLMNGIGGIGKTEICRHLFWYYCDNAVDGVENIGWINYHDSLESSLLGNFKGVEEKDLTKYIQAVKSRIDELGNKLLLFVDNANDISDKEAAELSKFACRIIMTSRKNEITSFHPFEVKKLSPEKCLEIYQKYSKDNSRESVEYIEKILELADYHTQTVELLAKTQKSSDLTAEELHKMLIDNGFSLAGISETVDGRHGDDVTNEIFIEHLAKIFDITTIAPHDKLLEVLRLFSLLAPNEPIRKRVLKDWFSLDNLNSINELIAKGWLKEDENNEISIHPVISEVVRYKYPPEYDFAKGLVDKLTFELNYSYEKGLGIAVWNKLIIHSIKLAKCFDKTENKYYASMLNNIGSVYNNMGDYTKALEYYEKALNIYEKVFGPEHPYTAASYNNIGSVYDNIGEYPKALEHLEMALKIVEKVLGTKHPDTATSYNNIGSVYDSMGNYNKALEYYKKALKIVEKALGTKHRYTAATYNNIGLLYDNIGDYPKALENHEKSLNIRKEVLGTEHSDTATSYNNIGLLHYHMGNYPKALEYYEKALTIREKVLGTKHPYTAVAYNNICNTYNNMGDYHKALEYYEKALNIYEKVFGPEHPNTATTYTDIGGIYLKTEEYDKALENLHKAEKISENILGTENPGTKNIYYGLAVVYMKIGDKEKTLEYYLKSR